MERGGGPRAEGGKGEEEEAAGGRARDGRRSASGRRRQQPEGVFRLDRPALHDPGYQYDDNVEVTVSQRKYLQGSCENGGRH